MNTTKYLKEAKNSRQSEHAVMDYPPIMQNFEIESKTLPDEIWELIISKLVCFDNYPNPYDSNYYPIDAPLELLSLVSKNFLSITNQLKQSLSITKQLEQSLHSSIFSLSDCCKVLLGRFSNLVRFSVTGEVREANLILSELARFQLPLQILELYFLDRFPKDILSSLPMATRSTLRSLVLIEYLHLTEDDMGAIGDLFPNLVELQVSYPRLDGMYITDEGMARLASKIRGLKRINLKCNKLLTDKSIISLLENCPNIEEINVKGCNDMTQDGRNLAMRRCDNIRWMVVDCTSCGGEGCYECYDDYDYDYDYTYNYTYTYTYKYT